MPVILKPASPLWRVSVALVRICLGMWPPRPSVDESAMLKHEAWAAAISSSGLLPVTGSSKREVNETFASRSAPLSVEALPIPLCRSPAQVPLAWRRISGMSMLLSGFSAAPQGWGATLDIGTANMIVLHEGCAEAILGGGTGFVKCGGPGRRLRAGCDERLEQGAHLGR